jgi:hypothetical protein
MYISSGTASLVNCTFVGNTVTSASAFASWELSSGVGLTLCDEDGFGGAILAQKPGSVWLQGCTLSGNSAILGSGLQQFSWFVILLTLTLFLDLGGALYASQTVLVLSSSSFVQNTGMTRDADSYCVF